MNWNTYLVLIAAFVILLSTLRPTESYKILVAPFFSGFNSRLLNMQKMADILAEDGHQVAVIMNNRVKDHIITKHAEIINFNVAENVEDITDLSIEDMNFEGFSFLNAMDDLIRLQMSFCRSLFIDDDAMKSIKDMGYDLILADLFSMCSTPLSLHLNITTIFYQNYGFFPESNAFYPLFPSFNCHAAGTFCLSDDMTFFERVMNTLFVIAINYYVSPSYQHVYENMGQETGIEFKALETILQDKVVIVNVDYVLDTPRPTMPHVFTISGLYHKKPSPLDSMFQKIIDQSGQHGVVLMSFGTLVPKFDSKTAAMFAKVLGRLKQQVIWRYMGEKPKGLQKNIHLTEWFPQNDLLANSAIKLFITHCGISSTFESAYNGVPVVAMPLFGDQPANAMKLTSRAKLGVKLDYHSVTEEEFEAGIQEVLSNPVYKENAKRVSQLMSDQLVPPVQKFRHLVNFTIKSGGAKHLFHPYAVRMSWFTYYGLDVISFLLTIIISVLLFMIFILRKIYRLCFAQKPKLKKQ